MLILWLLIINAFCYNKQWAYNAAFCNYLVLFFVIPILQQINVNCCIFVVFVASRANIILAIIDIIRLPALKLDRSTSAIKSCIFKLLPRSIKQPELFLLTSANDSWTKKNGSTFFINNTFPHFSPLGYAFSNLPFIEHITMYRIQQTTRVCNKNYH